MTKQEFAVKILMKQDLVDHLIKGISQEATHNDVNRIQKTLPQQLQQTREIKVLQHWLNTKVVEFQARVSLQGLMESFSFIQNKILADVIIR
ncbi:papain family cysteine protease (macronuclear) [Tetrahymena thermophila SB210]|uniref:Papain family cysteine protease n=1 Tax=Tetrahymena thermophila (strain SB210) TaxID=312017 RepID=W7XI73_TETTS|nr:papain family cysteine protease [Tetrahymena thermophila SB210]EWS74371.1 papain family cysteine protease [Tetrahymena thermophila SB210]|eukprot:XP_012653100.1 papain family cysteine protease [Tetrahymena thermophila SB210]